LKLTNPVSRWYKGHRLNLSYDRVLQVLDAMDDKLLSDNDKVDVALKLLVKWPRPMLSGVKLWNGIYEDCIKPKPPKGKIGPKSFDFSQDAEYIYAAFMQIYRIDLIAERNRLDWREFIALFQGLPEGTRIVEIMSIRAREYPAANKYNGDEIKALREAKQAFALDQSGESTTNFREGIASLFETLKGWAENNNKGR